MANFRMFYMNDGEAVAINVDLVKLIRTNGDGNAEILFVGDSKPVEFAMSVHDLHSQLINPHISL